MPVCVTRANSLFTSYADGETEVVPVQHVHRLTSTLVDILQHVAVGSQQQAQQQQQQQRRQGGELGPDIEGAQESSGLLSSQDDKLSVSSGASSSRMSGATSTTEFSLNATLLHASYIKEEYTGGARKRKGIRARRQPVHVGRAAVEGASL
jgi:hypothetical protein